LKVIIILHILTKKKNITATEIKCALWKCSRQWNKFYDQSFTYHCGRVW